MKALTRPLFTSIFLVLGTIIFASCSTTEGTGRSVGKIYAEDEVESVTVLDRKVEWLPATRGRVGGQIGSVAGSVGGGLPGSILGGMVGPAIEKTVVKKRVSHYTLLRADGSRISLLQDDAMAPFAKGQKGFLIRTIDGTGKLVASQNFGRQG